MLVGQVVIIAIIGIITTIIATFIAYTYFKKFVIAVIKATPNTFFIIVESLMIFIMHPTGKAFTILFVVTIASIELMSSRVSKIFTEEIENIVLISIKVFELIHFHNPHLRIFQPIIS